MIARNGEHFVSSVAKTLEEAASLLELLGSRTLGEIPADDHKVRLCLVDLAFDAFDKPWVMRSKMEVGQMNDTRH